MNNVKVSIYWKFPVEARRPGETLLYLLDGHPGEKVRAFAKSKGLEIVGEIPRSDDITRSEDRGMTTIEADPDLPVSRTFLALAQKLMDKPQ